jgi:hypothetical protein
MRGDISGSNALPELERANGKIAWQKTGGHAQMSGVVRREIRTIRRKSDYLKPSLQQVESDTHRKGI